MKYLVAEELGLIIQAKQAESLDWTNAVLLGLTIRPRYLDKVLGPGAWKHQNQPTFCGNRVRVIINGFRSCLSHRG